jgi:hypothetical protein
VRYEPSQQRLDTLTALCYTSGVEIEPRKEKQMPEVTSKKPETPQGVPSLKLYTALGAAITALIEIGEPSSETLEHISILRDFRSDVGATLVDRIDNERRHRLVKDAMLSAGISESAINEVRSAVDDASKSSGLSVDTIMTVTAKMADVKIRAAGLDPDEYRDRLVKAVHRGDKAEIKRITTLISAACGTKGDAET